MRTKAYVSQLDLDRDLGAVKMAAMLSDDVIVEDMRPIWQAVGAEDSLPSSIRDLSEVERAVPKIEGLQLIRPDAEWLFASENAADDVCRHARRQGRPVPVGGELGQLYGGWMLAGSMGATFCVRDEWWQQLVRFWSGPTVTTVLGARALGVAVPDVSQEALRSIEKLRRDFEPVRVVMRQVEELARCESGGQFDIRVLQEINRLEIELKESASKLWTKTLAVSGFAILVAVVTSIPPLGALSGPIAVASSTIGIKQKWDQQHSWPEALARTQRACQRP
jgi:hypothetical protein